MSRRTAVLTVGIFPLDLPTRWFASMTLGTFLTDLGISIAVLAVTLFVSRLASGRLTGILARGGLDANATILLARTLRALVWAAGIMSVLYIFGVGLTPLAAFIGVVGLAASLSLQTVLQNLVAGIYLLAEQPFTIGDTIEVVAPNGIHHEGTVEDIQIRTTHLRSRDHELILVPNATVFSGVVINRTAVGGYVTQVTVTFPRQTDPELVRGQVFPLLADLPAILSTPQPNLQIATVDKDNWSGCLSFWVSAREAGSAAIWAIGHAFPEATVNAGA